MDLHDLLDRRRTVRTFAARRVDEHDLVELLWATQGRTSDGRRTTPSAGGFCPLHVLGARGSDPAGTWSWHPDPGALMHEGRAGRPCASGRCSDRQPPPGRGRRSVDVEVGAAVQNLALSATAQGLAGVIVGGFDDDAVAEVLDVAPFEPRVLFSLGHPA